MNKPDIAWPTFSVPHRQTLRAMVFGSHVSSKIWLMATAAVALGVASYHLFLLYTQPDTQTLPQDPTFAGFSRMLWGAVVIVSFVVAIPSLSLFLHLRKSLGLLFSLGRTSAWRRSWLKFEEQSRVLTASLNSRMTGAALMKLLDSAPKLPIYRRIELDEYLEIQVPTDLATEEPDKPSVIPPLMGWVLSQFSTWKVEHATGYADGMISHVHMLDETTQFWVFVSAKETGPLVVLRIQSGILWWTGPTTLTDGTFYPGDVELLRRNYGGLSSVLLAPPLILLGNVLRVAVELGRRNLFALVWGVLAISANFCCWGTCLGGALLHPVNTTGYSLRPILTLVVMVPLSIVVLFRFVLDSKTSVGRLLTRWDPQDGDASDLIGLSMERRAAGGFGVVLSDQQKAALREAREQTWEICQRGINLMESIRNARGTRPHDPRRRR